MEKFAVGGELDHLVAWVGAILGGKYKIAKILWGGTGNLTKKIFFFKELQMNGRIHIFVL